MNHRIRPVTLLLCMALVPASVATSSAQAGSAQTQSAKTQSVRVHSFDLDLATKAGQAEFQRRIYHAVEQVCGPSGGVTMDERMSYGACGKAARASAMSQYDVVVRAAQDGKVATNQDRDVIVR